MLAVSIILPMPELTMSNPAETRTLGATIGKSLQPGDLVTLEGNLGAGKTTLVQGLAAGWGSTDRVTSPTFVLINEYQRPNGDRLFHMDAYRLSGPSEAEDLDIDHYLATGTLVVEWADRISSALPEPRIKIKITDMGNDMRSIKITLDNSSRNPALSRQLLRK